MKLRQKLAAVLAATMVVTAVPVVTSAATTNRITKSLTVAKDAKIGVTTTKGSYTVGDKTYDKIDEDNAPELVIEAKDTLYNGDVFFIKIKEGEFLDVEEYATGQMGSVGAKFEVRRISGSELQVTVKDTISLTDSESLDIPIYASAKSGETVIEILPENSAVSGGSFVIARTNEAKATLEIGDTTTFYTEGEIAAMTFEEAYVGAFIAGADDDGNIKVELTIDHDDFKFAGDQDDVAVLGRGLNATTPLKADLVVDAKDDQVATVTFKKSDLENLNANARGNMKISGIKVKATTKSPETGDLNVVIGGKLVSETTKKVATVADYGVNLKMKDEKAVEIKEGRTDRVTFTLAENVNDSMVDGRPIEFIFDNGHISHTTSTVISVGATDNDEIRKIKLGDTELTSSDYEIDEIWDEDEEKVIGFEFTLDKGKLDGNKIDKLTFEGVQVHAPLGNAGDITLKASGRMLGEEVETTAVTIKDAFEFETEAMSVKVGLRNQVGGKVVISETEKGNFKKGEKLVLDIEDGCGEFVKEPKVTVTEGDLKLNDVETKITKDGKLEITIKRASKEASTIEITDFVVDVDRTVPQGGFELNIGGAALTDCASTTVADFFRVGTPNTEDITNGMRKGTATFTNGATAYTVNGLAHEMDAAAYISKAGRMMLPVRYVSEAFGVEGNNVIFADGTVTILAGTRTLQLKNGSEVAVLNGAQIKMAEKVVITNGRTYVPVGEVGRLLGVSVSFDDATKTATFENK